MKKNPSMWLNVFRLGKPHLVDSVYMDFQKAFNKTPCQRLLGKLGSHDIRKVLAWITDW